MAIEVTFLGHAGFVLGDGTHRTVIDPFLTGNPVAKHGPDGIQCSTVLLTHGHEDHVGDSFAIAKANGATLIACHELSVWADSEGIATIGTNPGGKVDTDFGWVAFTQALHSSSHSGRYMGTACGIVVRMGGVTLYHCGDTGLFSDMRLIGEIYEPDIACIPVGDRYTMGPELATKAAEWIGAKVAIPIHFGTFPILRPDPTGFEPRGVEVKVLAPGDTWSFGA